MAIVVKTIRGRQYRYFQVSRRVGGKVVTTSTYLGPVFPRRRRGDGAGFLLFGLLSLGVAAAKGELRSGPYKEKRRAPDKRTVVHERERWLELVRTNPKAATADIQARSRAAALTPAPTAMYAQFAREYNDREDRAQEKSSNTSNPDNSDDAPK